VHLPIGLGDGAVNSCKRLQRQHLGHCIGLGISVEAPLVILECGDSTLE
jgi:hypothetical protein